MHFKGGGGRKVSFYGTLKKNGKKQIGAPPAPNKKSGRRVEANKNQIGAATPNKEPKQKIPKQKIPTHMAKQTPS